MKSTTFSQDMLTYIAENSAVPNMRFDETTDLIEAGIIDSFFSIMSLLVFIEEKTGVRVELEDLVLDTIRSVSAMNESFNLGAY
jgi:acyl carrier protein